MVDEEVMVVPRAELVDAVDFHGFTANVAHYKQKLLASQAPRFMLRHKVEDDPNLKQIIPYVVVTATAGKETFYFSYRRGVKQGEARLHKKLSIGIGGHVNPIDQQHPASTAWACAVVAARREMVEELGKPNAHSPATYTPRAVGWVNHDDDAVGKVHLGLVMQYHMAAPMCYPVEGNVDSWGWVRAGELLERAEEYEPWSRFVIQEGLHTF